MDCIWLAKKSLPIILITWVSWLSKIFCGWLDLLWTNCFENNIQSFMGWWVHSLSQHFFSGFMEKEKEKERSFYEHSTSELSIKMKIVSPNGIVVDKLGWKAIFCLWDFFSVSLPQIKPVCYWRWINSFRALSEHFLNHQLYNAKAFCADWYTSIL